MRFLLQDALRRRVGVLESDIAVARALIRELRETAAGAATAADAAARRMTAECNDAVRESAFPALLRSDVAFPARPHPRPCEIRLCAQAAAAAEAVVRAPEHARPCDWQCESPLCAVWARAGGS